jgi:hypothetical protein
MKRILILGILFLANFEAIHSQQISESTFGNGIINTVARDSSYSLKFGARFQSQFASQWIFPEDDTSPSGNSNFLIRRARLKFDGFAYSPKLEYKLELGLSNRDISGANEFTANAPRYILDAVVKWNFYKNFVLWAGQTKLPGNRERVISSGDLQIVDRSLLNSRFNIDRDIGFQLHHRHNRGDFIVKEIFSLSQGEGRNITTGNLGGYQYTARLEILPFGEFEDYEQASLTRYDSPKLSFGVTFDHNDDAVRNRSNMGTYMITDYGFHHTDINSLFIDFMLKYKGLSVMGEFAHRDAEKPVAMNSDGSSTGITVNEGAALNLQSGYLFKNNYEIVGRFTNVRRKFPVIQDLETQYTLGLSKYLVGHKLKVQADVSINDLDDSYSDEVMYRLQFDLHF